MKILFVIILFVKMLVRALGAKLEVTRFDGAVSFRLWRRRVKDVWAQQCLQKVLCETKSTDMEKTDREQMKDKVEGLINLCVLDEVMYHILEVWDKLESHYMTKTLMNKLFAKQRLQSLQMQECLICNSTSMSSTLQSLIW